MKLTAKKFWIKMNRWQDRLLLAVLVFLLLIVAYALYDAWYVYSHAADDELQAYKPTPEDGSPADSPITEDMVGWITIDDTNIDYPVMQGEDNTTYLNTDPYGNYSLSGSIFLDSRCAPDFSDDYSLIYGHHMEYGVMFGALDDFLDASYLDAHQTGTLLVGRDAEKTYDLHVFASMQTSTNDKAVFDFAKVTDLAAYIKKQASVWNEPKTGCRILALSTCAGAATTTRTLVFCYME